MRQHPDLAFSSFLDPIGENYLHQSIDDARLNNTQSFEGYINFVFPPSVVADPSLCITRAVLSPFNTFVDEFDAAIPHTAPGDSHCYVSNDESAPFSSLRYFA
jgi:hypothetical protein